MGVKPADDDCIMQEEITRTSYSNTPRRRSARSNARELPLTADECNAPNERMYTNQEMSMPLEQFATYFPQLKETEAWRIISMYFEHKQQNETKLFSFDRLVGETIPRIIRNLPPLVVKHGYDWHQFKFLDVVMHKPIVMNADGRCRMAVPQECLRNGMGYNSDLFVHIEYSWYRMECTDGTRTFVSRKQQQAQQKADLDAQANENMNNLSNIFGLQKKELDRLKREQQQQAQVQSGESRSLSEKDSSLIQDSSLALEDDKRSGTAKQIPQSVNIEPPDEQIIAKYGHLRSREIKKYVRWFELPVMLKSCLDNMVDVGGGVQYGECPQDSGGNVITGSGVEKVIMYRERPAFNQITTQHKKDGTSNYVAECRSEHYKKWRSTSTLYMKYMNRASHSVEGSPIIISISVLLDNIPWVILIRALGIESDEDIRDLFWHTAGPLMYQHPFYADILERCLEDNRDCFTTQDAINRLGKLAGGKTAEEQDIVGRRKLKQEVFPHLGYTESDFLEKARFLCNMMHQLLDTVEMASKVNSPKENIWLSNRDSYFNKRMELPEELLAGLIRQYIQNHLGGMVRKGITKKLDKNKGFNIYESFDMEKITKGLNYNLAMGVWHAQADKKSQTGVSQNMGRYNFNDTIDQHHKILNPIHKEGGKHIEPRLLDDTAFGTTCPHSPDGDQCGLVRYEAIFNHMSMGTDPDTVIHLLLKSKAVVPYSQIDIRETVHKMETESTAYLSRENGWTLNGAGESRESRESKASKASRSSRSSSRTATAGSSDMAGTAGTGFNYVHVMVNQRFIGVAPNSDIVIDLVKQWRRKMVISVDIGVSHAVRKGQHIVDIRTEAGRNLRPYFILENLWKLDEMEDTHWNCCRWEHFMVDNIIEYCDVQEQIEMLIAATPSDLEKSVADWQKTHPRESYPFSKSTGTFTHAELHGCSMYGLSAQFIPFSNFNAAVRNTFQVGQGKQAQGLHSTNARLRFDTTSCEMWYVQRPLVATKLHDILGAYQLPAGQNLTVGICSAVHNEEDSIVLNKDTVDAGYCCSSMYKTYTIQEKRCKKGSRIERAEKIGRYPREQCAGYKDNCDYSKLDERGIIRKGETVYSDTILVMKAEPRMKVKKHNGSGAGAGSGASSAGAGAAGGVAMELDGTAWDDQFIWTDTSFCNRSIEGGVVDEVYPYINEITGCQVVRIRIRNARIPEEADKFCLTPDHEVLTKQGWKKYAQLTLTDEIATLNPDNHHLEYEHPTGLYEFDHKGPLYHVKDQQMDLLTTLNHKMYVKPSGESSFSLKQAKDIYKRQVSYKHDALWQVPNFRFTLPHTAPSEAKLFSEEEMLAWLTVFPTWCVAGVSCKEDQVTFPNLTEPVQLHLHAAFNRLGWQYREELVDQDGGQSTYNQTTLLNKQLASYFQELMIKNITGPDLQAISLPDWCFQLSATQVRQLLDWMEVLESYNLLQFASFTKDLHQLCLHAGWSVSISTQNELNIVKTPLKFRCENKEECIVNDYNGKVFCVEVPNHVFYVRRNGKPVWTGNSSRHGQKGTLGCVWASEDMPYDPMTCTTVDLLYNPCAFISRMTYGQKVETVFALVCALTGEFGDASPHSLNYRKVLFKAVQNKLEKYEVDKGEPIEDIAEALRALGYATTGSISMISGRTNKRMNGLIFAGPVYMQKLKHMVKDKVRGRARGPMNMATKQASEGRNQDGGLKFGEMEVAVAVSYGAAALVQDKMFISADAAYQHICETCQVKPIYHEAGNFTYCLSCHRKNTATNNFTPATMSDFASEIRATGLNFQLETRRVTVAN